MRRSRKITTSEYASFCAPTVLAALMDCSREEAAEYLDDAGRHEGNGATSAWGWNRTLAELGGERVREAEEDPEGQARFDKARRRYYDGQRGHYPSPNLKRYTVAGFLRDFPEGKYVLTTTVHTLIVEDGTVTVDTMHTKSKRARVQRAYRFPQ